MTKRFPLLALTSLLAITASSTFSFGQTAIPSLQQSQDMLSRDVQETLSHRGPTMRAAPTNQIPAPAQSFEPVLGQAGAEFEKDIVRPVTESLGTAGSGAELVNDRADEVFNNQLGENASDYAKQAEQLNPINDPHHLRGNKLALETKGNEIRINGELSRYKNSEFSKGLGRVGRGLGVLGDANDALDAAEAVNMLKHGDEQQRRKAAKALSWLAYKKAGYAIGPQAGNAWEFSAEMGGMIGEGLVEEMDWLADENGRPRSLIDIPSEGVGSLVGKYRANRMERQQEEFSKKHRENYRRLKAKAEQEQRQAALEAERRAQQRQAAAEQAREQQASQNFNAFLGGLTQGLNDLSQQMTNHDSYSPIPNTQMYKAPKPQQPEKGLPREYHCPPGSVVCK